jgi:hypothetical protein
MGEFEKACHYYKVGISTLERSKILPFFVRLAKVCVAKAESFLEEKNINLSGLFDFYNTTNPRIFEGWMARNIGEILLNIDDAHISTAEDWIRKATEADKRNGTIWFLANDYALSASLFQRKGDLTKAKESLKKAIDMFEECTADGWAKKVEKQLQKINLS